MLVGDREQIEWSIPVVPFRQRCLRCVGDEFHVLLSYTAHQTWALPKKSMSFSVDAGKKFRQLVQMVRLAVGPFL